MVVCASLQKARGVPSRTPAFPQAEQLLCLISRRQTQYVESGDVDTWLSGQSLEEYPITEGCGPEYF